ncbi:ABC transporter ATP-binding protein [Corynebacterium pseudodiphtheriticum]|jgi:ABC superfamily ATP binding cassette transporter, permease/ABC protein|nr:ABC transporter ATP-binding protein [Corynebacterium pseudodiphtheriticum]OBA51721.1 ABC transporter [Corynebacterium sp. EPI-003-04-2554_SCH2473622]MDK4289046.1 ABC transporter ATP-binding protein [Corynebacterium pseudodiphtheriticum]RUP88141.1 ABC transporter ATP-binding protein [Corynebacterium pseudodiphtheriticum]RUP93080.1 ABC transporter ATP-binding protein [Corynebacterium pseudodiphtheriticum]RUP98049.1 ABC transporter ATP-binding protein [Corynebacterium pseudodiphtheriticum]
MLFTFAGALLSLVPIYLLASVIDAVAAGDGKSGVLKVIVWAIAACVGTAVVAGLAEALTGVTIARLVAKLRERAVAAVLNLPPTTVESLGRGEVLGRVGADVAALVSSARKSVPSTLSALVMVVVASAGIGGLDWRLALAGLCGIPFYALGLRWYLPRSAPLYRRQRELEAGVIGSLQGSMEGIRSVRSHRLVESRQSLTRRYAQASRDESIAAFRVFSGLVARENFAEFVGLSALSIVGWLLFREDLVSVGEISAALILFHRQFVPIGTILFTFDELQRSGAALGRIVGLIHSVGAHTPQPIESHSTLREFPSVEVDGLNYQYENGPKILHDLSFQIPAGRSVCVVGGSGAGKSTVAGIVSGTLEITEPGVITIDGRDVVEMSARERSSLFCVASQENYVFAMSLRDNLLLAAESASDAEIWDALRRIGAEDWCTSLSHGSKHGLDTMLGEGGLHVDAVAAQRLALARVALSRAGVVILDESTAEDDGYFEETQQPNEAFSMSLENAARAAIRGRTAMVIAHRLSQATTADSVVVMERGRVVETGSHKELAASGGTYADMWTAWNE